MPSVTWELVGIQKSGFYEFPASRNISEGESKIKMIRFFEKRPSLKSNKHDKKMIFSRCFDELKIGSKGKERG